MKRGLFFSPQPFFGPLNFDGSGKKTAAFSLSADGQAHFAGTARRVLRTKCACPLFVAVFWHRPGGRPPPAGSACRRQVPLRSVGSRAGLALPACLATGTRRGRRNHRRCPQRALLGTGPPLVFKTDNGPGFIGQGTGDLLAAQGILHFRNPGATPQYKGSSEAAGGSHNKTANDQATLTGHPGRWTSENLRRARMMRNRLGRPWENRGPTSQEAWQIRKPITPVERSQLNTTVDRYRQEERT